MDEAELIESIARTNAGSQWDFLNDSTRETFRVRAKASLDLINANKPQTPTQGDDKIVALLKSIHEDLRISNRYLGEMTTKMNQMFP